MMPSVTSGLRTRSASGAGAWALPVAVAALAAWLTWPTLEGASNEGFQSMIVLNAHAILEGRRTGMDLLYPLDNDFFLSSRLGVSVVLAGLLKLGLPSVVAFRLVMLASLAGLLAANGAILVRRYGVPTVLSVLPVLMLPVVFESAWFFNDNVLSAALSTAAMAAFWTRSGWAAAALAGLCWGLAVMCRTDAVLLAPAFSALVLWDWRTQLGRGVLAGVVAVAVPVLGYEALGLHLLDVLALTRRATEAWARSDKLSHLLHPFLKGIAYPGMLALAAGTVAVLVQRRWREAALCLGAPLVYVAAYGRMLTEVRYLLPLTPMLCILMVLGTRAVLAAGPRLRRAGLAATALAVVACLVPPRMLPMRQLWFLSSDNDMTRPSVGRIWSPVLGVWWNRTLEQGEDAAGRALEAAARPGGAGIVVSTRWTPDRLVTLALAERGFADTRASEPACRDIGEVFTRGTGRILHLRVHIPMLPTERAAVTWRSLAVPCLDALGVAAEAPILVVGQMVLAEPPAALHDPGVAVVFAPEGTASLGQDIAAKSYVTYVATAPRAAVVRFLAEPDGPVARAAAEAALVRRAILQ